MRTRKKPDWIQLLTENNNSPETHSLQCLIATWNGNYKKIREKGQYYAFPWDYWYGYEISELSALIIKLWYLIEKLAFAKRPGPPLSSQFLQSATGRDRIQGPGSWRFLGNQPPAGHSRSGNTGKVRAGLINSGGERCLGSGSCQRLGRKVRITTVTSAEFKGREEGQECQQRLTTWLSPELVKRREYFTLASCYYILPCQQRSV